MKSIPSLRYWCPLAVALLVLGSAITKGAPALAAEGSASSSATPSNAAPAIGDSIAVAISIDVSGVAAPDNALGSFSGALDWNPAVLAYRSDSGIQSGFTGLVNASSAAAGHLRFNGANSAGALGNVTVLTVSFDVIGAGASALDLGYSAMAAGSTFAILLPLLAVADGQVVVGAVADNPIVATEMPPACYALALSHAGQGSDPVADPAHSSECPPGRYVEGETIGLSGAVAGAGWQVGGWTGTSQDGSTAGSNSLTMPAGAHVAAVIYEVRVTPRAVVDGVTSGATDLSQPITEETEAVAAASPSPDSQPADSTPSAIPSQIAGPPDAQEPADSPPIVGTREVVVSANSGADAGEFAGTPPSLSTQQATAEQPLIAKVDRPNPNDSIPIIPDSPRDDSPKMTEQRSSMLSLLPVLAAVVGLAALVMLVALAVQFIKRRSAGSE